MAARQVKFTIKSVSENRYSVERAIEKPSVPNVSVRGMTHINLKIIAKLVALPHTPKGVGKRSLHVTLSVRWNKHNPTYPVFYE